VSRVASQCIVTFDPKDISKTRNATVRITLSVQQKGAFHCESFSAIKKKCSYELPFYSGIASK
jgi:hypothetical protein